MSASRAHWNPDILQGFCVLINNTASGGGQQRASLRDVPEAARHAVRPRAGEGSCLAAELGAQGVLRDRVPAWRLTLGADPV